MPSITPLAEREGAAFRKQKSLRVGSASQRQCRFSKRRPQDLGAPYHFEALNVTALEEIVYMMAESRAWSTLLALTRQGRSGVAKISLAGRYEVLKRLSCLKTPIGQ